MPKIPKEDKNNQGGNVAPLFNGQSRADLQAETREFSGSIHHRMDAGTEAEEETEVFELSLSSEIRINRGYYTEILTHTDEAIDLSRAENGGLPLLHNHRTDELIGRVDDVRVEDGKLRGTVRFGNGPFAQEIKADVRDGIRSDVSIGYEWRTWLENSDDDEITVTEWAIHEASIVGVPADPSVGFGRSHKKTEQTPIIERKNVMTKLDDNGQPIVDNSAADEAARAATVKATNDAVTDERKRVADVTEYCQKRGMPDMANQAVAEGWAMAETRERVLDAKDAAEDGNQPAARGGELRGNQAGPVLLENVGRPIGMNAREIERFSFARALHAQAAPNEQNAQDAAGFEREMSQEVTRVLGQSPQGIYVPADVIQRGFMPGGGMSRDLSAGTATDGAELIATNLMAGSFIDVLRNSSQVMRLGATVLSDLVGNVAIPRKTSGASAAIITTEGGDAAESDPQFDQVTGTPRTLGAFTEATRQLLMQSSVGVEQLIRQDLAQAMALEIDRLSLYGSGASGQPTGIANTTGINAPTNFVAAVPTFAEMIALETAVSVDNALVENMAYMVDPTTRGALKIVDKGSDTGQFVWEANNQVNGYEAAVTNQVVSGDVFYGNWADMLIFLWGGLDLLADPYTKALSGTTRIVAHQSIDVAARHPVSFAFNNDG